VSVCVCVCVCVCVSVVCVCGGKEQGIEGEDVITWSISVHNGAVAIIAIGAIIEVVPKDGRGSKHIAHCAPSLSNEQLGQGHGAPTVRNRKASANARTTRANTLPCYMLPRYLQADFGLALTSDVHQPERNAHTPDRIIIRCSYF
jgi:hypothetical protein